MHYSEYGHGDCTFVLVHGFLCRPCEWSHQVEYLSRHHRVIVVTLTGHDGRKAPRESANISALASDLAELVDRLAALQVFLIGHSMGCRIAIEVCLQMRQNVNGIVLIDGSRIGPGRFFPIEVPSPETDSAEYKQFVTGLFDDMFLNQSPGWQLPIVQNALTIDPAFAQALLKGIADWDRTRFEYALTKLDAPVLVIQSTELNQHGRRALQKDEISAYQQFIADTCSTVQIHSIPDTHHFCNVAKPKEVNQVIEDFVKQALSDQCRVLSD